MHGRLELLARPAGGPYTQAEPALEEPPQPSEWSRAQGGRVAVGAHGHLGRATRMDHLELRVGKPPATNGLGVVVLGGAAADAPLERREGRGRRREGRGRRREGRGRRPWVGGGRWALCALGEVSVGGRCSGGRGSDGGSVCLGNDDSGARG